MNTIKSTDMLTSCACSEIEEIRLKFGSKEEGFTDSEAAASRRKYGSNIQLYSSRDGALYCLRRAFVNPFSAILFFLGIITLFTDVIFANSYKSNPTSAVIIFSMLLLSGIVRLTQELKAKKIADQLVDMVQTSITVSRNGKWTELAAEEIAAGDLVRLKAGDRVPADIRITKAEDLFVSQSMITGESAILEKTAETLVHPPQSYADYTDMLLGGTVVTGGKAEGIVVAVGQETVYGSLSVSSKDRSSGFDRGANSIAWVMIRFMVILVPIVFLACGLTKGNWLQAGLFALSVAVGLTPELLPMVVNACLAKGSYFMGKKQTIVKDINAMQSFGSMDILCVDKTGTLTGDRITLEYYMDVLGNESRKTLDYAYLASCYHTGVTNHIDSAIRKVSEIPGQEYHYRELLKKHAKIDQRPFDYSSRFSGVLVEDGDSKVLIIKGSVDDIIRRCSFVEYGGRVIPMEGDPSASVHAVVDEMLEDGMKVIAVACKTCKDDRLISGKEEDFVLLGYLAFFDAPKTSAKSAILKLHDLNVNIKVLTGDHKLVAESICRRLGISTDLIITGPEIEALAENDIQFAVEKYNVFAGLSPKQKEYIIEVLQSNGHTVGFLGDGMNDLPAILKADVGISVENAAESIKESASIILMKKDLNILEEGVLEGRRAFANMSKYIKITASSNFGNICAIVIASVLLPFFPMTSVQLLLLNLLYDVLCLILPWDSVDEEMLAKPLEWSGKNLGSFMAFFGPLSSVFDLITFAVLYFAICPRILGSTYIALDSAGQAAFTSLFQTGWFLESMWTQVLILQLLRTGKLPFVQSKPGRPVIIVTVLGILLYTALPVTVFGKFLGLSAMPKSYYLFLIAVASAYLLLVSIAKTLYIRKKGKLI